MAMATTKSLKLTHLKTEAENFVETTNRFLSGCAQCPLTINNWSGHYL